MRNAWLAGIAIAALIVPALATGAIGGDRKVDPNAKLGGGGERVKVKVLLSCDQAQAAKLKVTVTQGSDTGHERALGRGGEKVDCTIEDAGYRIVVSAREGRFVPGKATACVLALTDDDARQWCAAVKLVG